MKSPYNAILSQAVDDLKEAKEYLKSIQDEFKDDPELLSFYEPSAQEIVRQYGVRLNNVLEEEAGVTLNLKQGTLEPEIWIRLQGNKFKHGTGPIDAVGSFLQKLNQASHKVISLLDGERKRFAPSFFNLVTTSEGSLKLGISRPTIEDKNTQLELNLEDPWEQLKILNTENENAIKSLHLLIMALDSENDQSMLELEQTLKNQNDILKLLHYAKDLTPSNRSPIDGISFEGPSLSINQRMIKIDKNTRKILTERSQMLKKDMVYIEGKALIRQQDMDTYTLTARPLILEDKKQYNEVKCVFSPRLSLESENYLGKFVSLTGFLVFGANNQPLRLEIEELNIEEELEEE